MVQRVESACSVGDPGLVPGLGRAPGEGNGKPTPVFLPGDSHSYIPNLPMCLYFSFFFIS